MEGQGAVMFLDRGCNCSKGDFYGCVRGSAIIPDVHRPNQTGMSRAELPPLRYQ